MVTAFLGLSDGSIYEGQSVGCLGQAVGELVFHTAMSGYQEIMTDPSYAQQIILFSCPHIGNVGVCEEDMESAKIHAEGVVIRSVTHEVSHWRSQKSLPDFLNEQSRVGIAEVDTRALTIKVRDHQGPMAACILSGDDATGEAAVAAAKRFAGMEGMNLAEKVTTSENYSWAEGVPSWQGRSFQKASKPFLVVVVDFGVKRQMLRLLVSLGCRVTVVPAQTSVDDLLALKPDGVLLSNGPGDPAACTHSIAQVKGLLAKNIPLFGICLGHQLLALALGAKTKKMPLGHHGANHPVQTISGCNTKGVITSQNHGFVVDENSLGKDIAVTQVSLVDGTVQGFRLKDKPVLSIQGHPEASPGPHDWVGVFREFVEMMETTNA